MGQRLVVGKKEVVIKSKIRECKSKGNQTVTGLILQYEDMEDSSKLRILR